MGEFWRMVCLGLTAPTPACIHPPNQMDKGTPSPPMHSPVPPRMVAHKYVARTYDASYICTIDLRTHSRHMFPSNT